MVRQCEASFLVAVDLGGTSVDAAVISSTGEMVSEVVSADSPADESAPRIVEALRDVVLTTAHSAGKHRVRGCVLAIPNPFDHAERVSRMDHKFVAIQNRPFGQPLEEALGFTLLTVNDADAFTLGVAERIYPDVSRITGVTIGTGLGGGFVEDGELVTDHRVPPQGEIWDIPQTGNAIFEHNVSAGAVSRAYEGLTDTVLTAQQIAGLAHSGDVLAQSAFAAVGTALGAGLIGLCKSFSPDIVVCGGKVSRSAAFFAPAANAELAAELPVAPPVVGASEEHLALYGAAKYGFRLL